MAIQTECEYCGYKGTIGSPTSSLEIRNHKIVCKDIDNCDKRWEENNPPISNDEA